MNDAVKKWTGELNLGEKIEINLVVEKLCQAFNSSPFFQHNAMQMRVVNGQLQAYVAMQPHLIGNMQYQILHGGSTATILDSVLVLWQISRRNSSNLFLFISISRFSCIILLSYCKNMLISIFVPYSSLFVRICTKREFPSRGYWKIA